MVGVKPSAKKSAPKKDKEKSPSMAAFGDKLDDITEALSILYIKNNASGRNRFREKLPDIAEYLFDDELTRFDNEGTTDYEHRTKLEEEANDRRILLKKTISEIIEKSVDAGVLNFDYVGRVIDKFGPLISQYLYAKDVVERVRPGLIARYEAEKEGKPLPEQSTEKKKASPDSLYDDQKISEEEAKLLSNSDDQYDAIKPIQLSDSIENPRDADDEEVALPGDEEKRAAKEEQRQKEEEKQAQKERSNEHDAPIEKPVGSDQNADIPDDVKPIDAGQSAGAPVVSEGKALGGMNTVVSQAQEFTARPAEKPQEEQAANPAPPLGAPTGVHAPLPADNAAPSQADVSNPAPPVSQEPTEKLSNPAPPLHTSPQDASLDDVKPIETAMPPQAEAANPAPPIAAPQAEASNPAPPLNPPTANPAPDVNAGSNPAPPLNPTTVASGNPAPPVEGSNPAPPIEKPLAEDTSTPSEGSNPAPPLEAAPQEERAANPAPPVAEAPPQPVEQEEVKPPQPKVAAGHYSAMFNAIAVKTDQA